MKVLYNTDSTRRCWLKGRTYSTKGTLHTKKGISRLNATDKLLIHTWGLPVGVIAVCDSKVLWCRWLVHLARCSRLQMKMLRASPQTHMVQPSQRPLALRGETRCIFMHHTCLSVCHIMF